MPSIPIKTVDELARQRRAGALPSVFDMLDKHIQPGITTMEINNLAEDFIVNQLHSRPASKGNMIILSVLNTSVNEAVPRHAKRNGASEIRRDRQRQHYAWKKMAWIAGLASKI